MTDTDTRPATGSRSSTPAPVGELDHWLDARFGGHVVVGGLVATAGATLGLVTASILVALLAAVALGLLVAAAVALL